MRLPQLLASDNVSDSGDYVLRHYYRGGLIAKITRDAFVFIGWQSCRSFAEFHLLELMEQLRLPVPKAIAARVVKHGLLYRADIIMQKIAAKDLVAILKSGSLDAETWRDIGHTIARFHLAGIDHRDLNAHNIMFDKKQVYLIDFDGCRRRKINALWQKNNIDRLKRSFEKEKSLHPIFHFTIQDWSRLVESYSNTMNVGI